MFNASSCNGSKTLGILAAGAAVLALATPGEAEARSAGSAIIATAVANVSHATGCNRFAAASYTTAQTVGTAALISRPRKRAMTALEKMRMQQANPQPAVMTGTVTPRPTYMPAIAMRASGMAAPQDAASAKPVPAAEFGISCAMTFDAARPGIGRKSFDFLESRILPISTTSFDADWNRVAGKGVTAASVVAADSGAGSMEDRIAGVNRWVNRKVAYVSDAKLYGKADHWASARETLRSGKGDCEDYAIAKMEILAAMGVSRDDMYLTIARDLVRRDDHAVLIVKLNGRAIMLDNASDALLDGDRANDYRPIMSFKKNASYLHGY